MYVRKMVVAVGVVALAVAGCGSDDTQSSGPPESSGYKKNDITLKVGEPATAPWNIKPDGPHTENTKVEVTTTSVTKGSIADFADFELNAQSKSSEPYYVTMTFRNVGDKPADLAGVYGVIHAYNAGADELSPLDLSDRTSGIAKFDKCQNAYPPDLLEVGAEYTNCKIYLAPSGQAFGKLVLSYFADHANGRDYGDITWNAG